MRSELGSLLARNNPERTWGWGTPAGRRRALYRHFELIETGTCQILLEARHGDIPVADDHYLVLKKDLSNIQGMVEWFKNEPYWTAMTRRAHEYVLAAHTHEHRVRSLSSSIFAT